MLGLLQMTLDECQEAYINLSKRIFKPKRWLWDPRRFTDAVNVNERFDSKVLEHTIREIIKKRTDDEQRPLKVRGEGASPCKV